MEHKTTMNGYESNTPKSPYLGWVEMPIRDACLRRPRTRRFPKVMKTSYKSVGMLPVVDQGKELIAGFVDDYGLRYRGRLPVIVFGDHTRILKYVDFPFAVGADGTQLITPSSDFVDVRFFYYALCNLRLKNLGYARHFKLLQEQIIRIPECLAKQREIATVLSAVDEAIGKTRTVVDQAQIVKRGVMQELFTRGVPGRHNRFKKREIGDLPAEWIVTTIGEIGNVVTGGTPNTSNHAFWNGTIPFVTPADLGRTKMVSMTDRNVSEEGLSQVREVPPGAVMVTCIGSIGKIGMAAERCCTNQQINCVITDDSILSEYVYYALSFTSRKLARLAGITAVPIVSKSKFLSFKVMVPPFGEQKQIVRVLSALDQFIEVNQKRMAVLTEVKLGLLSLLLTGELRVGTDTETA